MRGTKKALRPNGTEVFPRLLKLKLIQNHSAKAIFVTFNEEKSLISLDI